MIEIESRVTGLEEYQLGLMNDKAGEYRRQFRDIYKEDPKQLAQFVTETYRSLRNETAVPLEKRCLDSLALTFFAMEHAYATGQESPFLPWATQRLAALRAVHDWLAPDTSGSVLLIGTGEGKSSTVTPAALPALLLIKPHIDVMAQKPLTRNQNAARFNQLGKLFGISCAIFNPTSQFQGAMFRDIGGRSVQVGIAAPDVAKHLLTADVTYLMEHDLGHFVQRQLAAEKQLVEFDPSRRGAVLDEVDKTLITERTVPMVTSAEPEPIGTMIRSMWQPMKEALSGVSKAKRKETAALIATALKPHVDALATALPASLLTSPDQNAVYALAVLRFMFSQIPALSAQQAVQPPDVPLFHSDGKLTPAGWYGLRSRLYFACIQKPYDPSALIPADWDDRLGKLTSGEAENAIDQVVSTIRHGSSYIREAEGKLQLISPSEGYRLHSREYDPLVNLAMYVADTLADPKTKIPDELRRWTDRLTIDELLATHYSKFLALTGSGVEEEDVSWFQQIHNLRVWQIPPHKEKPPAPAPIYLLAKDGEEKLSRLQAFLEERLTAEMMGPTLIDVPSTEISDRVIEKLRKHFGDRIVLQQLDARNEHQASSIFRAAGHVNTITVVTLMARREVDIQLTPEARSLGGLMVIADEPPLRKRDERQLTGRAGRADDPSGGYVCLVSPNDEVFRFLSSEKNSIRRTVQRGDARAIARLVAQGQMVAERRLSSRNEAGRMRIMAFVPIRRHLLGIKNYPVRQRILSVWPSFLTLMDTRYSAFLAGWASRIQSPDKQLLERQKEFRAYAMEAYTWLFRESQHPEQHEGELLERFASIFNAAPDSSV